jgi:hypothetical protein
MASITYYVALAFMRSEGGDIVACEPKEHAVQAIAFSRTGDPALGDFEDAVILKAVGEVDSGLLST